MRGIPSLVPCVREIADANGWVYVDADDEYDAIANAIYADVVSTNGNEYQFGEGFASDAFTLSPNTSLGTSAADLNWYLNLNNQEGSTDYTGFAKMQVAPVIDGFYVYDDNNPDDQVTPLDATTQTLDVVPGSDGNAAVDLNAFLSDESAAVRQDTLWTLSVDHDSEIVTSGALSSDGSDTLIDLPSGYMQYTLKYGFDLNGDGDLSNSAEIQRVVTIDVTSHAGGNLTAQVIYATAGQTFTGVVATFSGNSTAAASDYNASITWGDGVITAGTVVSTDGSFEVDGNHTYSSEGIDAVQVSVWLASQDDSDGISDTSTAYVRDASLAADWDFGDDLLNGSSNAIDTSGNDNDGMLANGAAFDIDADGTPGLDLAGDEGQLSVADSDDLDPSTQITVAVSINPANWDNADATILQKGGGEYTLAQEDGQLVFSVNTTNGPEEVFAPLPSTGAWHTIVGDYDSLAAEITLNIDGTIYDASASGTIVSDTGALVFGDKPGSTSGEDAFDGMVEDASVYDAALTPAEIIEPDIESVQVPTLLSATATGTGSVQLIWQWTTTDARSFEFVPVYQVTGSARTTEITAPGIIPGKIAREYEYSTIITGLLPDTSYTFYVMAKVHGESSRFSSSKTTTTLRAPTMSISGSSTGTAETAYTLSLSATEHDGGAISGWTINWGDGSEEDPDLQTIAGNPPTISHAYAAGDYTISAVVSDEYGAYDAGNNVDVIVNAAAAGAPTDLTVTPGDAENTLTWNAVSGAASYEIYRGTYSGGETLAQSDITIPSYTDNEVTNGMTYFYQVSAFVDGVESARSLEQSGMPTGMPPESPTDLAVISGDRQNTLTWTASAGATSYNIYRSTTSGEEGTTAVAMGVMGMSFTDPTLTNLTTYYYTVAAVNPAGTSSQSSEAFGTPVSLTPTAATAPTNVSVTLYGGSYSQDPGWVPTSGTYPTGQQVKWEWSGSGSVAFDIYYSNTPNELGAELIDPSYSLTSGSTWTLKDPKPIGDAADPSIYYYTIVANIGGVTSAPSVQAYAPQMYYIEGYGDTSGPDVQLEYEDGQHIEFHYFSLGSVENPVTGVFELGGLANEIETNLPFGAPVVLGGFSIGGDAAYNLAGTLNSDGYPVAYLALFSPVIQDWESIEAPGDPSDMYPLPLGDMPGNVGTWDDWYVPISEQTSSYWSMETGYIPESYVGGSTDDEAIRNNYPATSPTQWPYHGAVLADPSIQMAVEAQMTTSTLHWYMTIS